MDIDEILFKQLDTYSSAIVGFSVLQGIGYLYYFGANAVFNSQVKSAEYLAEGLVAAFVVIGFLSVYSLFRIHISQKKLIEQKYEEIMRSMFYGKVIATSIFYLLPAVITLNYGVLIR